MQITVTVKGAPEALAMLKRTKDGMLNLATPFKDIGGLLTKLYAGEVFASRGRVIGHPWPRLAPATEREKDRRWAGRPAMIRTGKLQNSFRFDSGPTSLRIHNTAKSRKGFPYFAAHQLGTGRVPQRVMMALDDQRVRQIQKTIQDHLNKQIVRGMGRH